MDIKPDIKVELPPSSTSLIDERDPLSTQFLNYIHSYKKVYVFSPHLDDATLSMGSLLSYIAQRNIPVEVITFFSEGSPSLTKATIGLLAKAHFENAKDYFIARRKEDIPALRKLGNVKVHHLGYTDSAWRIKKDGTPFYPDMQHGTMEIDATEKALHDELVQKVKTLITSSENTGFFAPLGRGKHVDHQMIRNVAAEAFPQTIFYQDFPYSSLYENEDEFIKQHNLKGVEWRGNYEAKKNSILAYKTQYGLLFGKGPLVLPYEKFYVHFT